MSKIIINDGTRKCSCGELMAPDKYICPKCGSKVGLGPTVYITPREDIDDWDEYEAKKKRRQWKAFLVIFLIGAIALPIILFQIYVIQSPGWFLFNLICYEISFFLLILTMRWLDKKGEKNELDFDKILHGSMALGSIVYLIVWALFLLNFFVTYPGKKEVELLMNNAWLFFFIILPVSSYILALILYYPVVLFFKIKEWLIG